MAPPTNRARPNARKRMDDSAFIGPSGTKRTADRQQRDRGDVGPDELTRVKRKRLDSATAAANAAANSAFDDDGSIVLDFTLLPPAALHKYITTCDLLPLIHPGPYSLDPPPPPNTLLTAPRAASPSAPHPTRHQEDADPGGGKDAVLADVANVHDAFAAICQRHWDQQPAKETDTLVHFLHAVRFRGTQIQAGSPVDDS
ncbi:hypothetical protein BKA62DRAFT_693656 [Auriculariales sp. MPI-PUGE-AT-0066]|nr:hypothetical protein BKA62DRAFT_693656 [Auriculariales sp. MPI-PUGE-AT-0066]